MAVPCIGNYFRSVYLSKTFTVEEDGSESLRQGFLENRISSDDIGGVVERTERRQRNAQKRKDIENFEKDMSLPKKKKQLAYMIARLNIPPGKGGLCFSPVGRVTLVPGSPSLHVNRPFFKCYLDLDCSRYHKSLLQ